MALGRGLCVGERPWFGLVAARAVRRTCKVASFTHYAAWVAGVIFMSVGSATARTAGYSLLGRAHVLAMTRFPTADAGFGFAPEGSAAIGGGPVPNPIRDVRSVEKYLGHVGAVQSADVEDFQVGVIIDDAVSDLFRSVRFWDIEDYAQGGICRGRNVSRDVIPMFSNEQGGDSRIIHCTCLRGSTYYDEVGFGLNAYLILTIGFNICVLLNCIRQNRKGELGEG